MMRSYTSASSHWPITVAPVAKLDSSGRSASASSTRCRTAKRRIFNYYSDALSKWPVQMNPEPAGTVNSFWMPTIVVDQETAFDRQALLDSFKADNIDGRVFFWP